MGIIGPNGSGKSTLLKLLNGMFMPDKGNIKIKGKVGALIEVGAGFHPMLTGRENIYINGAILGMSKKEINRKIDNIIEFADIGDFLDTPVKNYSSGMYVRLGFAIAIHCNPNILLMDEILAVGDVAFRNKRYNKIGSIKKDSTIIMVSHNMTQISQICDKICVLSRGKVIYYGKTARGIKAYEVEGKKSDQKIQTTEYATLPVQKYKIIFNRINLNYGDYLSIRIKILLASDELNAILRFVLYNETGIPCAEWNSKRLSLRFDLKKGWNELSAEIGPMTFRTGTYRVGINLNDETGIKMLLWSFKKHAIKISSFTSMGPPVPFNKSRFSCNQI